MAQSTQGAFERGVSEYLRQLVFPAIVQGAQGKGIALTVEDLVGWLALPAPQNSLPTGAPNMPAIPGFLAGTGATSSGATPAGGRRRKPTEPVDPANQCKYFFTRGGKKGQQCEGAIQEFGYCKDCLKKKTVKDAIAKDTGSAAQMQPPNLPNTVTPPNSAQPVKKEFSVEEIEGEPGVYRDVNYGFIVRQLPDTTIIAIAREIDGARKALTVDDHGLARELGLGILDQPAVQQAPAQVVQQAPVQQVAPVVQQAPVQQVAPVVQQAPAQVVAPASTQVVAPVVQSAPAQIVAPVVAPAPTPVVQQPPAQVVPQVVAPVPTQADAVQAPVVPQIPTQADAVQAPVVPQVPTQADATAVPELTVPTVPAIST